MSLGSSPHTDWGLLTLIIADDIPGLQIYNESDDKYYTVKPRFNEGKIFVNCGDYMSLLSKGKFISPKHRVISPDINDKQRISNVFFFYPNYNATIPNMDINELQSYSLMVDQSKFELNNVKLHNDITFGEYIKHKWEQVSNN